LPWPLSVTATQEFVVSKSMPISFAAMSPFSFDSHPQRRISMRASRRAEATN
jgi:hypothetical protein